MKRKRNITWFNPPFNIKTKTKVGKTFLKIVKESFKEDHPLKKIFNKNVIKVSYSSTANVKNMIRLYRGFKISQIPDYKQQTTENELNQTTNILNRTSRELMQQAIEYNTERHNELQAQRETTWIQLTNTFTDTEIKLLKSNMDIMENQTSTVMKRISHQEIENQLQSNNATGGTTESQIPSNDTLEEVNNYKERDVQRDGNCLFRCISLALTNNGDANESRGREVKLPKF